MDSVASQAHIMTLFRRDHDEDGGSSMSPTIQALLIALVALLALSILLVLALFLVRRLRRNRAIARQTLPTHNCRDRLTITTTPYGRTSTLYLYDEKSPMIKSKELDDEDDLNSPDSVPEIRITFPDEQDDAGRRKSGRVVVVRVGEHSVGLEPVKDDDQLPAYEREGKWQSIDMNSIGGLKEKTWA